MSVCFKVLESGDVIENLVKISSFRTQSRLTGNLDTVEIVDIVSRQKAEEITEKISQLDTPNTTVTGVDYSIGNSYISLLKQGSQQEWLVPHGDKATLPDAELSQNVSDSIIRVKQLWQSLGAEFTVYEEIEFTEGDGFYPDGIYVSFEYGAYTGYQNISHLCEYSDGFQLGDEVTLEMNGNNVSVSFLGETIGTFTISVLEHEEAVGE